MRLVRDREVFLGRDLAGESTEYWEQEWASVDLAAAEAAHRSRPGPTMRLLERYVPGSGRVLEAGCGASTYAAALRSPGRSVVGVDLAGRALEGAARQWPDLGLVRGDVRRLPFASGTFDAVISFGVVEHLPEGPVEALAEHARVLAPGGVLLVSVPWVSIVKAGRDLLQMGLRRQSSHVSRGRIVTWVDPDRPSSPPGRFHQFELTTRSWDDQLRRAGLEVVRHHPYEVSYGIGELRSRPGSSGPATSEEAVVAAGPPAGPPAAGRGAKDLLRRVVIREEPGDQRWEQALCSLGRHLLGHMVMTVARRR